MSEEREEEKEKEKEKEEEEEKEEEKKEERDAAPKNKNPTQRCGEKRHVPPFTPYAYTKHRPHRYKGTSSARYAMKININGMSLLSPFISPLTHTRNIGHTDTKGFSSAGAIA